MWEEIVVNLPRSVQMCALSATMNNCGQIRKWFEAVHGPTELIETDFRPVPLRYVIVSLLLLPLLILLLLGCATAAPAKYLCAPAGVLLLLLPYYCCPAATTPN